MRLVRLISERQVDMGSAGVSAHALQGPVPPPVMLMRSDGQPIATMSGYALARSPTPRIRQCWRVPNIQQSAGSDCVQPAEASCARSAAIRKSRLLEVASDMLAKKARKTQLKAGGGRTTVAESGRRQECFRKRLDKAYM